MSQEQVGAKVSPTEIYADRLNLITKTRVAGDFVMIEVRSMDGSKVEFNLRKPTFEYLAGIVDTIRLQLNRGSLVDSVESEEGE